MISILIVLIFLYQPDTIFAQTIPKNNISYESKILLYDAGLNWESLSNFSPIKYKINDKNYGEGLRYSGYIGVANNLSNSSLFFYNRFVFKNYFYIFFQPVFNNQFIGSNYDPTIKSLNYVHKNINGIGFQNNWLSFQIGRGNENWAAGNNIELALSDNSGIYDYLQLASDYKKVRVKYIHGFLESKDKDINRYITARGIEWTNQKSFIIGLSEIVIYSGENRSFDIGYLNPISSHLEVELNNRLNIIGDANSNAVWQIHLDYLLNKRFRLSSNFLYDEYVIDKNIQKGKEHGRAFSTKIAYTPIITAKDLLTIYLKMLYIGTPTFRHAIGSNNFVQNNKPLGTKIGSDAIDNSFGINYYNRRDLIFSIYCGLLKYGEENIVNRAYEPYEDYQKGEFPSGEITHNYYLGTYFRYWHSAYLSISSGFYLTKNTDNENIYSFHFGIEAIKPLSFDIR